jgi:hypothetical protein
VSLPPLIVGTRHCRVLTVSNINSDATGVDIKGDDYMTDEERQEALTIARALFNDEYIKTYLHNKR